MYTYVTQAKQNISLFPTEATELQQLNLVAYTNMDEGKKSTNSRTLRQGIRNTISREENGVSTKHNMNQNLMKPARTRTESDEQQTNTR